MSMLLLRINVSHIFDLLSKNILHPCTILTYAYGGTEGEAFDERKLHLDLLCFHYYYYHSSCSYSKVNPLRVIKTRS